MLSKNNSKKIVNLLTLVLEDTIYDEDDIYKSFNSYYEYEDKVNNLVLYKNETNDFEYSLKYKENELVLINFFDFLLNKKLCLPYALDNKLFLKDSDKFIIKSLTSDKIFYIEKIINTYTEFNLNNLASKPINIEPLLNHEPTEENKYFIFHRLNDQDTFKYFNLLLFKIFDKINGINKSNPIAIQCFEIFESISKLFFKMYNLQYVLTNLKCNKNIDEFNENMIDNLFEINNFLNKKNEISDQFIEDYKTKINEILTSFYEYFIIDNKLIFKNNLKIRIDTSILLG
jgi:hypothetical protein